MKERPHSGTPFADEATLARPGDDDPFMREALAEAGHAAAHGDVPIGAAVVRDGRVVARAHNRREVDADPTAHAELIAMREAARVLGRWRLSDCALYVTVEPCGMCAGAAVLARIALVVFGAPDEKAGAVRSVAELLDAGWMNHHPRWRYYPLLRDDVERLLREFFEAQRRDRPD
ncbi:MAG TPA: nucleoside deaminase [Candidatus Limnocylindria bacterium]|jgi:tRNA(adenine34) deaminase|nr:nucleoside deaminase [Candidatus Limnocylindria bacterium]